MTGKNQAALIKKQQAIALIQQGRFSEAKAAFSEICRKNESDPEAWFMLGAVNGQLGKLPEAISCCKKVISLNPSFLDAYYNLGEAYNLTGKYADALAQFRKVLTLNPDHPVAKEKIDEIVSKIKKGIFKRNSSAALKRRRNTVFDSLFDIGCQCQQLRNWEDARVFFQAANEIKADHLPTLVTLGKACEELGELDRAIDYHRKVLELNPNDATYHFNLGNAFRGLVRLPEAIQCYEAAIGLKSDYVEAMHNLGIVMMHQGMTSEAKKVLHKVLEIDPGIMPSRSCLLCDLNYVDVDPGEVYREHREWEKFIGFPVPVGGNFSNSRESDRRLRVGYVSPDWRMHSVVYFIEPLLSSHNKESIEVVCYSDVTNPDGITRHMQTLSSLWRDICGLGDAEVADLIRRDKVDILVDLAGHTAFNRLGVFARKPAPVQVSYLGYPNTTGLSTMDYRLTDEWADPPGQTEQFHSEELVRLPNGFLSYHALDGTKVYGPPVIKRGYVTFGSFNNLAKVSASVVELWSRVLHAVPDSRLLIKYTGLEDPATRDRMHGLFADMGVEASRVELVGWVDSMSDHMDYYRELDIALDTFPYNGTTTTCEALWMGVPVITLAGCTHPGRVGISILSQLELGDFVAQRYDDYIDIAARLASDLASLQELRLTLRARMEESALCDSNRFAGEVEQAYRKMWRRWCESCQAG